MYMYFNIIEIKMVYKMIEIIVHTLQMLNKLILTVMEQVFTYEKNIFVHCVD